MSAPAEWYRTLFSGLFVEAQRRFPQQTQAEADFLVQHLEPRPGAKLLDVPCGNGRLSIAMAQRGYALTGVDQTAALLDDGRTSASEKKLPVSFEQRDMRDLPWAEQFDGAFCFGNSFSYLGEAGDRDFLAAVFRALKPGGRFVLETHFCAEGLFLQRLQKKWFALDDLFFLVDTSYEPATATLTSSYTVIRDGHTERHQAHYHVYTYRELMRLFESVGFQVQKTFGSLGQEPYNIGAQGPWIVAIK